MNQSLEELASSYVLDQLEPGERAEFEARLLHDPNLAARVRELETTLAARIRALPQQSPAPDLLARIEARLDRRPQSAAMNPIRFAPLRWALLGGLAALILVGIGFTLFQRSHPNAAPPVVIIATLDSGRTRLAELPVRGGATDADGRFIQLATLAERFWNDPGALPVKLAAVAQGRRGYAIFDPATEQGFIAVRDIPTLKPGQVYHLWIVDTRSGHAHEAGVLPLNTADRGLFSFSVSGVAEENRPRLDFLVTAQDASAARKSSPTGQVVLGHNPF